MAKINGFGYKIYTVTNNFPKEEVFGLTSQIKRSAISIPSNIAEGLGRESSKEFLRFLKYQLVHYLNYKHS